MEVLLQLILSKNNNKIFVINDVNYEQLYVHNCYLGTIYLSYIHIPLTVI